MAHAACRPTSQECIRPGCRAAIPGPTRRTKVTQAWLNRIGTAVPPHDIHAEFVDFALSATGRARARCSTRMAALADIQHRYAIFEPGPSHGITSWTRTVSIAAATFPPPVSAWPGLIRKRVHCRARRSRRWTWQRSAPYAHLIVASCTGFAAPGLDFHIMRDAGLRESVERHHVGFMGCFAAVNALKLARHIVRSEPTSLVLVVNLELCSLHLQEQWEIEKMLSFLLFGDGCRCRACLGGTARHCPRSRSRRK